MEEKNSNIKNSIENESDQTILDLFLIIIRGRWLIIKITLTFVLLGIFIAVFSPNLYESRVKMIPEISDNKSKISTGLSALRNFGLDFGNLGSPGLTSEIYPDIIKSNDVLISVIRDSINIPDIKNKKQILNLLEENLSLPGFIGKYILGLPQLIIKSLKGESKNKYKSDCYCRSEM